MTITSEQPEVSRPTDPPRSLLDWQRLVNASGLVAIAATGLAAVFLTDIEGGVVALILAFSTWLFRSGRRRAGVIGLTLVSAVTLYFMGTAAVTNVGGWAGVEGTLIALGLSATSALVIIASLGWILRRDSASFGPWLVLGVIAVAFTILLVSGVLGNEPERTDAGIELTAENVAFDRTALSAPSGEVTVSLENRDLFWHTFTIEELDVDLRVPVSAEMTVTFDAPPGEYRFFCNIPGHPEAGMEGTLLIEEPTS